MLCVKRLRTVSFGAHLLAAERRVGEFFPGYGSISVSLKRLDPLARLTGLRALCRKASLNRSLDRSLFEPLLGLEGRYLRAPSWEPKGLAQRRATRNLVGESCCVSASSNFLKVVGGVRACRFKGAGTFCLLNAFGKGLGTRRFSQLLVSTAALSSLKSGHLDTIGDAPDVSRSAFRKGFSFEPTLRSPLPDKLAFEKLGRRQGRVSALAWRRMRLFLCSKLLHRCLQLHFLFCEYEQASSHSDGPWCISVEFLGSVTKTTVV